jgi:hypothetical protein
MPFTSPRLAAASSAGLCAAVSAHPAGQLFADLMADLPDPVGTMWRDHTNLQQQRLSGACVLVPQHPNLGST